MENLRPIKVLEKQLEDIIYDLSQTEKGRSELIKHGLVFPNKLKRQINLGSYGIMDLMGVYITSYDEDIKTVDCVFDIIELKKGVINTDTFMQALRYAKGLSRAFENGAVKIEGLEDYIVFPKIKITLIGSHVDSSSSFCYMPDVFYNTSFFTYQICPVKGILFTKQKGYRTSIEKIKELTITGALTKYSQMKPLYPSIKN